MTLRVRQQPRAALCSTECVLFLRPLFELLCPHTFRSLFDVRDGKPLKCTISARETETEHLEDLWSLESADSREGGPVVWYDNLLLLE